MTTSKKCVICHLSIDNEEEWKWAMDDRNHPGMLGPCHEKCYDKMCQEHPETPWEDPISGEVDYEAMAEDLDVDTGEEWGEEGEEYY